MNLAITHGHVDPVDDGTVLIRDGKIVEVPPGFMAGTFVSGRAVYSYPEGAVEPFSGEVRK